MKWTEKASRVAPRTLYVCSFTCGAWIANSGSWEAAKRQGEEHQEYCCAKGGHHFVIVAFERKPVQLEPRSNGRGSKFRVIEGGKK
jgi:hypothetical protein